MNIRTFVTILSRKAQCNFPKMRGGGGSKAVWNFSENSSDLLTLPVPKRGRCAATISLLGFLQRLLPSFHPAALKHKHFKCSRNLKWKVQTFGKFQSGIVKWRVCSLDYWMQKGDYLWLLWFKLTSERNLWCLFELFEHTSSSNLHLSCVSFSVGSVLAWFVCVPQCVSFRIMFGIDGPSPSLVLCGCTSIVFLRYLPRNPNL